MRHLVLLGMFGLSMHASAAIGDIQCFAEQYEVTASALKNHVRLPLVQNTKNGPVVGFSTDIGDRAFNLSGNLVTGDFMLSQTWGEGYTSGILTTGTFNSSGRLVISQVEGAKVSKLTCTKVLASDFPSK